MNVTLILPDLGHALAGVMRLDGRAFVDAMSLSHGAVIVGLLVVLLAGFSEAVAQSIVLFANRVKPARFIFSWATDAFMFLFGYGFLVASTWAVCQLPWAPHVAFRDLALVFALSYAPLLFSFLGALPYLGPGVFTILRVWHLLAMIVGVSAVGGASFVSAASYVALGWVVYVLAAQSFGRPIAGLGRRLLDAVAGVKLVDDENAILGRVESGGRRAGGAKRTVVQKRTPSHPNAWKLAIGFCAIVAGGFLVAVALDPVRDAVFGWEHVLPAPLQVPLDLMWLGVVAFVVAALMAPLETLGWWAGWYGDRIDTTIDPADAKPEPEGIARYVLYLDGIAQSSAHYTPDIETFLDAFAPELPGNVRLIRGVMVYSVMNRPLEDDPFFSLFWKAIDALRLRNVNGIVGMLINLRNVFIVAVSADPRYGPMYNFGIAQVMYRALIAAGYRPRSGVPVTLVGYSGGGQMACAAAHFLRRAIDGPVDVISLGGVISGNDPVLELEHVHHLVGDKDTVEPIGPIMFPSRWKIAVLSNWNRARRLGRLTRISLGPVGHQVPGGMFDPVAQLPDGRTNLRATLDTVESILEGRLVATDPGIEKKIGNYERYIGADWNRPEYYPVDRVPARGRYLPVAAWVGRLILPARDARFGGVLFEVRHAPDEHAALRGRTVRLMMDDSIDVIRDVLRTVTRDVAFSAMADYTSVYGGYVHPVRVNRWRLVNPLESLAASHPVDDVIVKLPGLVAVESAGGETVLRVRHQPVQITGPWYALVRFLAPEGADGFRVVHFDPAARDFTGEEEVIRLPAVVPDADGRAPSVSAGLEVSPLNAAGWYVYGAPDARGDFVVQALAPRAHLRPSGAARVLRDKRDALHYVRRTAWREIARGEPVAGAEFDGGDGPWKAGDVGLLTHAYGGIGGGKAERFARSPFYFGHFAYGIAEVVRDPLADEPRFELTYYQVYTHNPDGLIAGALDWTRYMGDRQFGWAGLRPVCDAIYRDPAFTTRFEIGPHRRASALDALVLQLDAMTARYRIGDGTGGTYVGAANNCSQDSNRALFATLESLRRFVQRHPAFTAWIERSPHEYALYQRLDRLAKALRRKIAPFGTPRLDWARGEYDLGTTMEDAPLKNLAEAFASWPSILPRLAFDSIASCFFADGASAWILSSRTIGGARTDVAPIVPMDL